MAEVHHESTTPAPVGALFRVLAAGSRDPAEIYTAIQEILEMAGHNVVTRLTAVIEAATARNEAALADQKAMLRAELAEDRAEFQAALARDRAEFRAEQAADWAAFHAEQAQQKAEQAADWAAFHAEQAAQRAEFRAAIAKLTTTMAEIAVGLDAVHKQERRTCALLWAALLTALGILATLLTVGPRLFG